jgi:hypothetical protein
MDEGRKHTAYLSFFFMSPQDFQFEPNTYQG